MRPAQWLLAAVLLAFAAGCAAPQPPADGPSSTPPRTGGPGDGTAGPFFLVAVWNKDFFGSEAERAKDRFATMDPDGRLFRFVGTPGPGSGRLTGPDSAFVNVTRADAAAQLAATGHWNASRDHAVETAWLAQVPQAEWGALRRVLAEEREVPEDTSGQRVGCADGGSVRITVSAPEGRWERTVGCLGDQSPAEAESGRRILRAYSAAEEAARRTVGAPDA